jgi:hypothetical protein
MAESFYDLDRAVFNTLRPGATTLDTLRHWQGAASGIADYVATWGMERFWAMSRSPRLLGGGLPDPEAPNDDAKRYFAWAAARVVLCQVVGQDFGIQAEMNTREFQNVFRELDFSQQVILSELLIEVADAIQFWTMRFKDALNAQHSV